MIEIKAEVLLVLIFIQAIIIAHHGVKIRMLMKDMKELMEMIIKKDLEGEL